jgi:hypothetical protein
MLFNFNKSKITIIEIKGKGFKLINKYLRIRISIMLIPLKAKEL